MRYLGGKSRIAKHIAPIVNAHRRGGVVWEPFCGGLSVTVQLSKGGPVLASDANAALINLYQAVAAGWGPPEHVVEETYQAARMLPDTDPLKAFCGFGCSFGGKWFGGYARSHPKQRDPIGASRNALLRDVPAVVSTGGSFEHGSCFDVVPGSVPVGSIYCDPPYAGTTGYAGVGAFDHERFYRWCVDWSRFVPVFVSEYSMPVGRCVWNLNVPVSVNMGSQANVVERLYLIGDWQ